MVAQLRVTPAGGRPPCGSQVQKKKEKKVAPNVDICRTLGCNSR